jgi:hypothetical protein
MPDYMRSFGAPAAQLRGEFFVDSEKDGLASAKAGRDIFRTVERVRIVIPGAVASIVVKNVDDTHRERWPEAYAAFKRGQEAPLQGMPLEEWPILNKAAIAELHYLQIRTVEELRDVSDLALQNIMGGQALRERARAWFDDAEHEALTTRLLGENDTLRLRVVTLETQVEALGAQMLQMASAAQHQRDMMPAAHAYVPGQHDPHEIAKAAGAALMPPVPGSALEALAQQSGGGRRRRRPEQDEEAV